MKILNRLLIIIPAIIIIGFCAWYFSSIIVYILISAVLSIMGQPLVKLFDKIKYRKFKLPHFLSAFFTLIVIILFVGLFFGLFVPIIINQGKTISEIDIVALSENFEEPLQNAENLLKEYEIIKANETLEEIVSTKAMDILGKVDFTYILNFLLGLSGNIFIGTFSILFMTFFFLKDEKLFYNGIMALTPDKYMSEVTHILIESKRLLTRYFIGVCLEIIIMVTLLSLGLSILGVKNALLIGFLGGLMNIIPYVGPIIGSTIGSMIGITSNLSTVGEYTELLPIVLVIVAVFAVCNLIDNIILQPLIYSNSVKAHPLEIFIVIMMAGSLAGVVGMILAIPAYTVMRIIAKEFFSRYKTIKKLTESI